MPLYLEHRNNAMDVYVLLGGSLVIHVIKSHVNGEIYHNQMLTASFPPNHVTVTSVAAILNAELGPQYPSG